MALRPASILVVDDEDAPREALTLLLERWGHEVQACESGASALRLLERGGFDVVLSDLVMPEVGGLAMGLTLAFALAVVITLENPIDAQTRSGPMRRRQASCSRRYRSTFSSHSG